MHNIPTIVTDSSNITPLRTDATIEDSSRRLFTNNRQENSSAIQGLQPASIDEDITSATNSAKESTQTFNSSLNYFPTSFHYNTFNSSHKDEIDGILHHTLSSPNTNTGFILLRELITLFAQLS